MQVRTSIPPICTIEPKEATKLFLVEDGEVNAPALHTQLEMSTNLLPHCGVEKKIIKEEAGIIFSR